MKYRCLGPYPVVVLNYVALYSLQKYNHFKHLIKNHGGNPVCTARVRLQDLEAGLRKQRSGLGEEPRRVKV